VLFVPVQPPEAVQEVAFVAVQLSEELPPTTTEVGFAVNVRVGAAATATLTLFCTLPPVPLHTSVYV
jgi:hypothetical protein